jgi:sRNA-binding regulator protein Hfq
MNDVRPLHANRDVSRDYHPAAQGNRSQGQLSGQKPKFEAKGHDKALLNAETKKLKTLITTVGGEIDSGIIVRRDRYTVTLATDNAPGKEIIYFKHALESISIEKGA